MKITAYQFLSLFVGESYFQFVKKVLYVLWVKLKAILKFFPEFELKEK